MQVDQPGCGKTPFVPDAFFRKLNELPCQLGASDILAYRHAAGSIIPIPSAVERPGKRLSDILIIRHKISLIHGTTQPASLNWRIATLKHGSTPFKMLPQPVAHDEQSLGGPHARIEKRNQVHSSGSRPPAGRARAEGNETSNRATKPSARSGTPVH